MNIAETLLNRTPFRTEDELLTAANNAPNTFVRRTLEEMYAMLTDARDAEYGVQMYMRSLEQSMQQQRDAMTEGKMFDADFIVGHAQRLKERQVQLHAAAIEFRKYNAWFKEGVGDLSFDDIVAMGIEENGMAREPKVQK